MTVTTGSIRTGLTLHWMRGYEHVWLVRSLDLGSTRHDNDRHNSFRGEDEVACALAGQADGAASGEMKEREPSVNRQATMNKGRDKIKMKMETETGISQQRYPRDGCRMEQGRQGKALAACTSINKRRGSRGSS
ncbi:hypothetical protein NW759_003308 [Fusarium solani]|jgi:hypothetical protein|nr:hypothetical protein NW759_003308 [Fusarium solani]